MSKTGLILARYQPPHLSHIEVFQFALEQGIEKLIVLKGSADKYRIPRHPFTPEECMDMLDMYLKRLNVEYHLTSLHDLSKVIKKDDDELTEEDLRIYEQYARMVVDHVPKFNVVIARNPLVVQPFQNIGYDVIKPVSKLNCSATYIRRQYTLYGDRCEDLMLPEQVEYMDRKGLYNIMEEIGKIEFKEDLKKMFQEAVMIG